MRYAVIIEKGEKNYSAYVPDLPGCVSVGDTLDEVKQAISEAIAFHLDGLRASGEILAVDLRDHLRLRRAQFLEAASRAARSASP